MLSDTYNALADSTGGCNGLVKSFRRWHKGDVEAMHEWLGMGFFAVAVLHGLRHRKPLAMMLSQYRPRLMLFGTALVTAGFLVVPQQKTASPVKQTVSAVLRAPLGNIAGVWSFLGRSRGTSCRGGRTEHLGHKINRSDGPREPHGANETTERGP